MTLADDLDSPGCVDLLAAIIRRAVLDARSANGKSAAARAWLVGSECAVYLDWLDLDAAYFRRLLSEALASDGPPVQLTLF